MKATARLERLERQIAERERPGSQPLQSFAELARVYCECERTGKPFPVFEGPTPPWYHGFDELAELTRPEHEAFEAEMWAIYGDKPKEQGNMNAPFSAEPLKPLGSPCSEPETTENPG